MDIERLKILGKQDESLRPYQMENKEKIYSTWQNHKSVMLQMPTGTGKTRLFVSIIKDTRKLSVEKKKDVKVLILVHRTELIDQISETLEHYVIGHGFIQSGDRERKFYAIQLASVQTLSRRLDSWNSHKFDVIIVDEAHHIKAESYKKIINTFPDAYLLGVTATPYRLSGEGFDDVFEDLIISPPVKKFIEYGFLSEYNYYSVNRTSFIQKAIESIKKFSQGDYDEEEMARVCDNNRIRAQVVETYLKYANGKKGIVYTINREHNIHLCKAFNEQGINSVALDAKTPKIERIEAIEKFRRGDYQIICNVNLFSEGFDCPDIEFVQLARPTKSLSLFLQQVGRGLRKSENKDKTVFLDNVGLYNKFGFPSSYRNWKYHFIGRKKERINNEYKQDINERKESENKRKQNLQEGDEMVFLIQTSDDLITADDRKQLFFSFLERFKEKDEEFIASRKYEINDSYNISIKFRGVKYIERDKDKINENIRKFLVFNKKKGDIEYKDIDISNPDYIKNIIKDEFGDQRFMYHNRYSKDIYKEFFNADFECNEIWQFLVGEKEQEDIDNDTAVNCTFKKNKILFRDFCINGIGLGNSDLCNSLTDMMVDYLKNLKILN